MRSTRRARRRVGALVYIGDAMEENVDRFARLLANWACSGVKAFMFQEGDDPAARRAFREIARLTGGAYAAFDASAPRRLAELLGAAAAYAVGGRLELERRAGAGRGRRSPAVVADGVREKPCLF